MSSRSRRPQTPVCHSSPSQGAHSVGDGSSLNDLDAQPTSVGGQAIVRSSALKQVAGDLFMQ